MQFFSEFTHFTNVSRQCFLLFPCTGEVKQIHTHKEPPTSLFLHQTPSVKSTLLSLTLLHHDNATQKYQFSNYNGSIYWHLCIPLVHLSVGWSSEIQSGVIYFKTWGSIQPYIPFLTLEFHSCFFVFGGTHTTPNSLTVHMPGSVVSYVNSF